MSIINSSSELVPYASSRTGTRSSVALPVYITVHSRTNTRSEATLTGGFARTVSRTGTRSTVAFSAPIVLKPSRTGTISNAFCSNRPPRSSTLTLAVNIVPAVTGNYIRRWKPRMKIDGIEVDVLEVSLESQQNTAGVALEAALANLSDRSLLELGAGVEFGWGEKIAGVWDETTFHTEFTDGVLESVSESITGPAKQPADTCTIRVSGGLNSKLATSPETDLIIHDPDLAPIDIDALEILQDTEGRQYPTEILPVAGLSLYKLLHEICVVRCGFTAYKTNLPDMQIDRADCTMGESFLQALSPHIGIFEPQIVPSGNEIWILDMTNLLPTGFPAPLALTVDTMRTLSIARERAQIDAYRVLYSEKARDWDFVTTRTEVTFTENGSLGDPGYYSTLIQRSYREYRKFTSPNLILREELYRETQERSNGDGNGFGGGVGVFSSTREDYSFNEQGQQYARSKRVQGLVPTWNQLTLVISDELLDLTNETERFRFAAHPFKPSSQYCSRRELEVSGLYIVDTENQQLGRDFKMPYGEASRKGNLDTSQTILTGLLRSLVETSTPLRSGQVETEITEIDYVSGQQIDHPKDRRPGDISQSGLNPQPNQVLVFADGNTTRATGRVVPLSAGSLNQDDAVALARRKLKASQLRPRTVQTEVIAYRPGFEKGMPTAISERGGASVGNFLIVGRRLLFNRQGLFMQLTGKEF